MLKEKRSYIAVIHKNKSSDYGVIFPDFAGCITAGKTLEEAKNMAFEALQFHIDGMVEDKETIPEVVLTLDEIKKQNKKAEAFLIIDAKIPVKAARINVSIDEKLLRKLDKYLEESNFSRSSFFADAARKAVSCNSGLS